MIRNPSNTRLTPAIRRFFIACGHDAAARMPEDEPIAQYVRHQIDQLIEGYNFLDDQGIDEALLAWNHGFSVGIRLRIDSNVREVFAHPPVMFVLATNNWPTAYAEDGCNDSDHVSKVHPLNMQPVTACANVHVTKRITGTLHLPRRGAK